MTLKLPGLLFSAELEFLSLCRDITQVYTRRVALRGTLCYHLCVPVCGDPSDLFDVFKFFSFLYKLNEYFVQTFPSPKRLAVSEDRNACILINYLNIAVSTIPSLFVHHWDPCTLLMYLSANLLYF